MRITEAQYLDSTNPSELPCAEIFTPSKVVFNGKKNKVEFCTLTVGIIDKKKLHKGARSKQSLPMDELYGLLVAYGFDPLYPLRNLRYRKKIVDTLNNAVKKGYSLKTMAIKLGREAKKDIRNYITSGVKPKRLADSTISRRLSFAKSKGNKSGLYKYGVENPLYETGQLNNAISYHVEAKTVSVKTAIKQASLNIRNASDTIASEKKKNYSRLLNEAKNRKRILKQQAIKELSRSIITSNLQIRNLQRRLDTLLKKYDDVYDNLVKHHQYRGKKIIDTYFKVGSKIHFSNPLKRISDEIVSVRKELDRLTGYIDPRNKNKVQGWVEKAKSKRDALQKEYTEKYSAKNRKKTRDINSYRAKKKRTRNLVEQGVIGKRSKIFEGTYDVGFKESMLKQNATLKKEKESLQKATDKYEEIYTNSQRKASGRAVRTSVDAELEKDILSKVGGELQNVFSRKEEDWDIKKFTDVLSSFAEVSTITSKKKEAKEKLIHEDSYEEKMKKLTDDALNALLFEKEMIDSGASYDEARKAADKKQVDLAMQRGWKTNKALRDAAKKNGVLIFKSMFSIQKAINEVTKKTYSIADIQGAESSYRAWKNLIDATRKRTKKENVRTEDIKGTFFLQTGMRMNENDIKVARIAEKILKARGALTKSGDIIPRESWAIKDTEIDDQ